LSDRASPGDPANLLVFDSAPEAAPDFDISDPEFLRTLETSQRTHFWFVARNRQILDFLRDDGAPPPARILEVGCGTGTVLSALAAAGYETAGLEMHRELARRAAEGVPRARIFCANVFAPPEALLANGPFDVVALFDVLEHLENPEAVLRACAALLRPGGLIAGTLPALSMLWSDYDAFAGHRLRYDRPGVRALFARAGLPRPRAAYFFQGLMPGMLARRMLVGRGRARGDSGRRAAQHRALDTPSAAANGLFSAACAAERAIRRGISLDAVAGASLWFSLRVSGPARGGGERGPISRTGGER